MSEYDIDVDLDDVHLDDAGDTTSEVHPGSPDPLEAPDVYDVTGSTVEFEDGTTVDGPHQDALGYVYKSTENWIAGDEKHVVT